MKKVFVIIMAALMMPAGAFAAGHAKHKASVKKAAPAKKSASAKKAAKAAPVGGMVLVGKDGKPVDLKKDKCWNPNDRPYRAPGWC